MSFSYSCFYSVKERERERERERGKRSSRRVGESEKSW
jgi:hypothetical protein